MTTNNRSKRLIFATLLILTTAVSAQAYVDPGSGSMFLQILIAGFLGIAFAIGNWWKKVLAFFGSKSKKTSEPTGTITPKPALKKTGTD